MTTKRSIAEGRVPVVSMVVSDENTALSNLEGNVLSKGPTCQLGGFAVRVRVVHEHSRTENNAAVFAYLTWDSRCPYRNQTE